ncbi:MAG: hypothetical protein GF405_02865 [Candidatus Eisenbacteria bacterium]|nr:hypothetical protein [Candidatus Eisenbacteria bacterium]
MARCRVAAVLLCVALAAAACGGREDRVELARVNSSALTVEEFYASVPDELLAVMDLDDQKEALEKWVKTEIFYQAGVRNGVDCREDLVRRLHEIERELVAEAFIREELQAVEDVTEDEARAYFEEHRQDYSLQVRLAHILVRSRPEAERALEEIRGGSPFETVAASTSIDQTAAMGGDLGYMRRGEMIHELEEPAFDLKVGEVSDVIPSSYGYHIIKVLDRHPGAGRPSFDSKRTAVMNFLTSKRRRAAFDDLLARLESRATVAIDTVALRDAARSRVEHEVEGPLPEDALSPADTGEVVAP